MRKTIKEATTEHRDQITKISTMTLDEYFAWQNPQGKMHGVAYDVDIAELNRNYSLYLYGKTANGYMVYTDDSNIVAFVSDSRNCDALYVIKEKTPRQRKLVVNFDDHVIIHDQALYTDDIDQEDFEDYIYGFGFFRENVYEQVYFYSFEYVDEATRIKLLYCMLQQAKDEGLEVYIGTENSADIGNYNLDGIQVEDVDGKLKTITLTKDVVNVRAMQNYIKLMSSKHDKYGEKTMHIAEVANYMWDSGGSVRNYLR